MKTECFTLMQAWDPWCLSVWIKEADYARLEPAGRRRLEASVTNVLVPEQILLIFPESSEKALKHQSIFKAHLFLHIEVKGA